MSRAAILLCASTAVFAASSAFAQAQAPSANQDPSAIPEVVVTATRRGAEPLQTVPLSVAVVSGKDLERSGDFTFGDVGFTTGNFTSGLSGDNATIGIATVRGISGEASVYVDDVLVGSSQAYNATLLDVDRVEVLRGPQGTAFGANTIAGALNTITRLPSFTLTGSASADFGDFGYQNYRASVSGPIITDVLAAKFAAFDRHSSGYDYSPLTGNHYNGDNEWGFRTAALYRATPSLEFLVSADYSFLDAKNVFVPTLYSAPPGSVVNAFISGGLLPNLSNPYGRQVFGTTDPNRLKRINEGVSIKTDWKGDGLKVTNILAVRSVSTYLHKDEDYLPAFYAYSDSPYYQHQLSEELRVSGTLGKVSWLGGFFYLNNESDSKTTIPLSGDYLNLLGLSPSLFSSLGLPSSYSSNGAVYEQTNNINKTEDRALYGSADITITDKLHLTLGARYTSETVQGQSGQAASNLPAPYQAFLPAFVYGTTTGLPSISLYTFPKINTDRFDPSGSLLYSLTPNIHAYVSASTGYHSPGFNSVQNCQATPPSADNPCIVKAETALDYEAGIKTEWLSHRLQVNLVAYHLDLNNSQLSETVPGVDGGPYTYKTVNANVTSEGVELEFVAKPLHGLTLQGSFGYAHAVYDSYPDAYFVNNIGEASPPHCYPSQINAAQGYCIGNATGVTLPFAPEISGSVSALYEGSLTASLDYFLQVQDEFRSSQTNNIGDLAVNEVSDLNVVNVALGLRTPVSGWSLTVRGRNIGNDRFITNAAQLSTGETYVNVSQPRFWSVELGYKF